MNKLVILCLIGIYASAALAQTGFSPPTTAATGRGTSFTTAATRLGTAPSPPNITTPTPPLSCFQGWKAYTSITGPEIAGSSSVGPCPAYATQCDLTEYVNAQPNGTYYIRFGRCSTPATQTTCNDVRMDNSTVGMVLNCSVSACSTNNCNVPMASNQSCPQTPSNDVQILPMCTLKQTLNQSFECMGPWFKDAPYNNPWMCKTNLDQMVRCLGAVTANCLSGSCPTILDFIPGVRAVYPTVVAVARSATSLSSALGLIPNISQPIIDLIQNGICPSTLGVVDPNLLQLLSTPIKVGLQQNVCTGDILDDLIKWSVEAAVAMQRATTHGEICTAMNTFGTQIVTAWHTRCSADRLDSLLRLVLTADLQHLIPKIRIGIQVAIEFMQNLKLPGCPNVPVTPAPMCFNGTVVTYPNGTFISRNGGYIQCQMGVNECGSIRAVNTVAPGHTIHWVTGFCSHTNFRPTCDQVRAGPQVVGTIDSCSLSFCSTSNCNNPDVTVMPSCDRFYAGTSSCMKRRAWVCDYVNWRVEFLSKWMKDFRQWKIQNFIPVTPLPQCASFRPVNMCKTANALKCELDINQCHVCYCTDHDYTNLAEIEAMWMGDYNRWKRIRDMYNNVMVGNNAGGTC